MAVISLQRCRKGGPIALFLNLVGLYYGRVFKSQYFGFETLLPLSMQKNIQKAEALIKTIRANFKNITQSLLTTIYRTYFVPTCLYASQVWYNLGDTVYNSLHDIYKKFWRLSDNKFQIPENLN